MWGLGNGAGEKNVAAEQQLSVSISPFLPPLHGNKNDDVIEQRKMYGPKAEKEAQARLGLRSHVKS